MDMKYQMIAKQIEVYVNIWNIARKVTPTVLFVIILKVESS